MLLQLFAANEHWMADHTTTADQLAGDIASNMHFSSQSCLSQEAQILSTTRSSTIQRLNQISHMSDHSDKALTGYAVWILVLATSRGSTADHMTVPASPPHPIADAESFITSHTLGLGLSGALLPGKLRRRICRTARKVSPVRQQLVAGVVGAGREATPSITLLVTLGHS